jgi:hypothetical protein
VHKAISTAKNSISWNNSEGRCFQKDNSINYKVMCDKQAFDPFHAYKQYKNEHFKLPLFMLMNLINSNLIKAIPYKNNK